MVGARLVVLGDAAPYGLRRAPDDRRVHEPVAAARAEVLLGEAEAQPVVRVVGQLEVHREDLPPDRAGPLGVLAQYDLHLGREQRPGAEGLAGLGGVLRRHEVRVRAGRAGPRELQHLRAECREDAPRGGHGARGRVERVEVGDHRRVRLAVVLHGGGVARAEAEEVAARVRLVEVRRLGGDVLGRVLPDVEDAVGDGDPRGRGDERGGPRHAAVPAEPHRPVPQLLQFPGRLLGDRVPLAQQPVPDADTADVHAGPSCRCDPARRYGIAAPPSGRLHRRQPHR
ncbi:hypothetical protein GA0115246_101652 [Streptomyces sp. SolWspMP-sol7th]|nr:hypothetical protein GA0115246_101652 [Streptomyces sp. SolWspMP-sol7th]